MAFTLKINGTSHEVDVDGDIPLLWVLRDVFGMTGTKFGCGKALYGACTVHVDGAATQSCITTVDSIGESAITTIEAIGQAPQGAALQKAWLELEVVQCGYCQSGQIMSAAAVEAMGSSEARARELLISTEQDHKGALVAVRDSGPGIDPECLERIFVAFYTTKSNGMGMGPSICRSIVEAHGGRLWAEANEPRGALFQFTLPNASAE